MDFEVDSVKKGRTITDIDTEKLFYGVTVSEEEWQSCTDFEFIDRDLSFRGLEKVEQGLVVAFDSSGMNVDLVYENPFRLIDQQEVGENGIIESFKVQPMGGNTVQVVQNTKSKPVIPRLINDYTIAVNFGHSEKVLPFCL